MIDLDDLLEEANAEALSRKIARGAKPKDPIALAEYETAAIEQTWEQQAICAVYAEDICECGSISRRFVGWYRFDQHRREASSYRWVAVDQPDGNLETYQHTIRRDRLWCECCTHVYCEAAPYLPVEALGTPCECCCDQLELQLEG